MKPLSAGRLALLVIPLAAAACGQAAPPDEVRSAAATAEAPAVVDATTLEHKNLFGYQGWFLCPGDGSPVNGWTHWFRDETPTAADLTVDLWPDTTELGADELFATDLRYADGSTASLYSAVQARTVARHFTWMRQAGIDGVALQRFVSELSDPDLAATRDQVTRNVQAGAEAEGRVFAIEYDVTGTDEADLVATLEADWKHLVDTLEVTASPRYLHDGGKPVLFLWGLGFTDRPGTPAQAAALVDWLTTGADPRYRATVVGGVPSHWRTLDGDAKTDPAWAPVYRAFDVLSPWTVGRFADDAGADAYRARLDADLAAATAAGQRFMPVVFPGFSWHNLDGGAPNAIPRRGGAFYWRQVSNAVGAGATMLKTAMFDEVDEGTAMFKLAPTAAALPAGASLVPLDADGRALPSDFYLRLGGAATATLRGDLPVSSTLPIDD
ncbi:MAG TPA: glycoside hydrolase family 71/99-like protein [Polyangia bacterium]|nr:glycoside hydrolase family 71/99-like protein [Polyangia bacterium]